MQIYILFPKPAGFWSCLGAFFVRLGTWDWRHGQRFAEVPSHVAIVTLVAMPQVGSRPFARRTLYESVAAGCHKYTLTQVEMEAMPCFRPPVRVPLPMPSRAKTFLEKCCAARDRYDWPDIEGAALSLLLTDGGARRLLRRTRLCHAWLCSTFVYIALREGGLTLPVTKGPATPSRLSQMLPGGLSQMPMDVPGSC